MLWLNWKRNGEMGMSGMLCRAMLGINFNFHNWKMSENEWGIEMIEKSVFQQLFSHLTNSRIRMKIKIIIWIRNRHISAYRPWFALLRMVVVWFASGRQERAKGTKAYQEIEWSVRNKKLISEWNEKSWRYNHENHGKWLSPCHLPFPGKFWTELFFFPHSLSIPLFSLFVVVFRRMWYSSIHSCICLYVHYYYFSIHSGKFNYPGCCISIAGKILFCF